MDISPNNHSKRDQKIGRFFQDELEAPKEKLIDFSPEDGLIEEHSRDVLMHWRAPEFEKREKDKRWYLIITFFLAAIILFAIFKNSPIMAITFILIGITGYLALQKDPRVLDFRITYDGIIVDKQIYEFDHMRSFWIFYNPPYEKILSIHLKGGFVPYLHIPIHDEDPVEIRRVMLEFIPELKQERTMIDTIERLLGI